MAITWNLEGVSLQIKTDSSVGSNQAIEMYVYSDSDYIGAVGVKFASNFQYWVGNCNSYTNMPTQPTAETEKIWTIAKTETAIIFQCNDVEVVNYLFADSSNSKCTAWNGNVVERIKFGIHDNACDFYRSGILIARV